MNKVKLLCACLLATAALPGPAGAGIWASTTLRGMQYTLYDLDPNDGITPSLVFDPTPYERAMWSSVNVEWVQNGVYGGKTYQEGRPDSVGSQFTLVTQADEYRFSGDVSGRADISTVSLGTTIELPMDKDVIRRAYSYVQADPYTFAVSPNTKVVFQNELHTDGQIHGMSGLDQWYNVTGQVYLWVYGAFPNNPPTFHDFFAVEGKHHGLFADDDITDQMNETSAIELSFSNLTNTTLKGEIHFQVGTNTGGQVTAIPGVPEPQGYLMFAAGLGLCGIAVRRGRAAAALRRP